MRLFFPPPFQAARQLFENITRISVDYLAGRNLLFRLMNDSTKFRNLAIIAHVDHGKTTLVDKLLEAGGTYRENQAVTERAMDSMDLEREKGITIKAKNTSIQWNGYTVNIVDTPGHADFGGEVERVMKMVDGVLLVVDAFDGPQAQTRFVLRKALQEGLKPIVVINKIDRPNSDPIGVHSKVLELLMELGATDDQFDAPFVYGSARDGYFADTHDDPRVDCSPLLNKIIKYIPAPKNADPNGEFIMLISNISWDYYVGRVAIGRITSGSVKKGDPIWLVKGDGSKYQGKVMRVFEYGASASKDSAIGIAGNIVGVAGIDNVDIGETLCASSEMQPLPFVAIDPPTISMEISVNDGPLGGKDGKNVTSRVVRERLMREMRTNISIKVEDTDKAGVYAISARGAMQIAVLVETMRRENYEMCVSRPKVILKRDESGALLEPYETMYVEVPDEHVGGLLKLLNVRKVQIEEMESHEGTGRTYLKTCVPTRGIIGFEFELVNLTSGHGIFSHLFRHYGPYAGDILLKPTGRLVSMQNGVSTRYALLALEDRGHLFIGPQEEIYAGQIVGENPRPDDMPVNPCKEKHLDNMRSAGKDPTIKLQPPVDFSLERAIEYIAADELVEATPHFIRMRKRTLDAGERKRADKTNAVAVQK